MVDGKRFKERLETLGLSEESFAKEAGLTEEQVEKALERQSLSDKYLDLFAQVLLCSKEYLEGKSKDPGERCDLGSNIRFLRYKNKMTVEDLAEKAGLLPSMMKKVEANQLMFRDKIAKIAELFSVSEDKLYGTSPMPHSPQTNVKEEFPAIPRPERANSATENIESMDTAAQPQSVTGESYSHTVTAQASTSFKEDSAKVEIPQGQKDSSQAVVENTAEYKEVKFSEIGTRLQALREKAGLTAQSLAEKCGVSSSLIRGIEKGTANPKSGMLERIARELGSSAGALSSGEQGKIVKDTNAGTIGDVVKALREDKGWNIPRLSIESSVSKSTIASLENGSDTNIVIIDKLARALDCPLSYLLNFAKPDQAAAIPKQESKKKEKPGNAELADNNPPDIDINNALSSIISQAETLKEMFQTLALSEKERALVETYRKLPARLQEELEHNAKFLYELSERA